MHVYDCYCMKGMNVNARKTNVNACETRALNT